MKSENVVSLRLISSPFAGKHSLAWSVGSVKMVPKNVQKTSAASSMQRYSFSANKLTRLFFFFLVVIFLVVCFEKSLKSIECKSNSYTWKWQLIYRSLSLCLVNVSAYPVLPHLQNVNEIQAFVCKGFSLEGSDCGGGKGEPWSWPSGCWQLLSCGVKLFLQFKYDYSTDILCVYDRWILRVDKWIHWLL